MNMTKAKPNRNKATPIENRVVALDTLTPHARNYNRHGDAQLADLRESLRQFGQVRSVVVQADKSGKRYTIVAGHGIAEAARAEGYTELRADVIPHNWSETRVLAYLAADNELGKHADPDADQLAAIVRDVMEAEGEALARLAAGEQSALDAILNAGNATEETADVGELVDKAAELQKKWNVARGDVWQIGKHRLMCGDSTSADDVATLMQGETFIPFLCFDPPYKFEAYGGGVADVLISRKHKDALDPLTDFDSEILFKILDSLSFGSVAVWSNKELLFDYLGYAKSKKMMFNIFVWVKNGTQIGRAHV